MARPTIPIPELSGEDVARFERHLRRDEATGCLLWTGAKLARGYGRFKIRKCGKTFYAHRVAFVLAGGVLSDALPHVLHNCPAGDNPSCCEPKHLFGGSHADNVADMARKQRGAKSRKGLPFGVRVDGRRFSVQMRVNGKPRHFGMFDTVEAAAERAQTARAARDHSEPSILLLA